MEKIYITGGNPLNGKIHISGSKNASLPLMAACLLTAENVELSNLPHLLDIATMSNLLLDFGVNIHIGKPQPPVNEDKKHSSFYGEIITFNASKVDNFEARCESVVKMRASILVLGPLLARFGKAKISLPGGCAIGSRPINFHLKAFEKMGVKLKIKESFIEAYVDGRLQGADISFERVSVGATENVLMAASLAEGTTVITNAAMEPEIVDLCNLLVKMGAKIKGIGTDKITVEGVKDLKGAKHSVIFDRIEAATYIAAVGMTGGHLKIVDAKFDHMDAIISKFRSIGIDIAKSEDGIEVFRNLSLGKLKSSDITTSPYPGFPTDMQAQFMSLMLLSGGVSTIREVIFENRFMHVPELCLMGAEIELIGKTAVVKGVNSLRGAKMRATDLRASVSLVLAALASGEESIISNMHHIDRGYERIEEKLKFCGADIERVKEAM